MDGHVSIQSGALLGVIKSEGTLRGEIQAEGILTGSLSLPVGFDKYTGSYEITPKTEQQVIPTSDKLMTDDMTIHKIPYFETSNVGGGNTVYIGTEVI